MSQINWLVKDFASLDKNDLYKIIQLRNAVFVVEQNCIYQDADGKDDKAWHLFAKNGDKIVAYARLFKTGDYFDKASIGRVVVDAEYRHRDLGKILMQKAMTFIFKNLNENTIEISAQTYLDQFYRDLGFIPYGDSYLEDGIPHIRMVAEK